MKKIIFIFILIFSLFTLNGCEIIFGGGTQTTTTIPTNVATTVIPTQTVTPTMQPTVQPTAIPTTVFPTQTVTPTKTPTTTPTYEIPDVMNLSIIEMNDVHGFVTQNSSGTYGLSNAAYRINQIRNEDSYDNTVLIANGDMFQGTGLVKMSYGRVMIEAMNEMKFDACGIGNHEFDWGLDKITQYFDGDSHNGEANFPLLNIITNIY